MRGFVTGADGFIGAALCDELESRGWEAIGLTAEDGGLIDLRDGESVVRKIVDVAPDVIFHLGAVSGPMVAPDDPALVAQVNCVGTVHVLEGARAAGVPRFIYASSLSALDGGNPDDAFPLTVYGATKRFGELVTGIFGREEGKVAVSARIGGVYGPGRRTIDTFDQMLLDARSGGQISYAPGAVAPMIAVEDVAASLYELAVMDKPPAVCDLVTQTVSERTMAEIVADAVGVDRSNVVPAARKDDVTLPYYARTIFPELVLERRIQTLTEAVKHWPTS